VLAGAQRRAAHVLGALEVQLGEVVGGEEEVLRAGLAEDRQPGVAGARQLGDGLAGGDVDDVQRGAAGDPGELDGAVGGLGLEQHLADLAVVARIRPARRQGLLDQHVDGDAVLGVHHDRAAVARRALHGPQDLAVVAVEDARVGHEELERGDALVDQQVHLLERGVGDVGEDHVEGVVDGTVARGLPLPGVEPLAQRAALRLHREVDDRGGAAPGGGPAAGLEGVGGEGPAECRAPAHVAIVIVVVRAWAEAHVGVGVDAAGDDVLPGGVDDLVGGVGPALLAPEGDDPLAFHEHIRLNLVGGGDHQPALDDGSAHVIAPSASASAGLHP
jgi:hypothetical protein